MKFLFVILLTCVAAFGQSPAVLLFGGRSGFTPPESSELVLWLKPESLSGANGDVITNWADSSGKLHHFTNTPTAGPILSNAVANGYPVARFLGAATSFLKSNTNFMSGQTTGEVFVVLRSMVSPGSAGKTALWDFGQAGHSGEAAHPFTDGNLYESFGLKGSRAGFPIPNSLFASNLHFWNVAVTTNYFLTRYNGNITIGNDVVSCGFTNLMQLGAQNNLLSAWDGEMAEVLMWNTIISSNSRATVYSYLSNKYAVAVTNSLTDYTPSSFPGLLGWWDASDITSNHNDKITYWADKSGFNNFWTNNLGQAGFRPTFHANQYNGRPAVWFDPANTNYMILTNAVGLAMTNYWTVIAVHQLTNDSRDLFFIGFSPFPQLRYRNAGNNAMQQFNGSAGTVSGNGPQAVGQLQMDVMYRQAAGDGGFWMNATNQSFTGQNGSAGPYRVNLLSINDPTITYAGHVAEVCIYTNVLNPDQITKLYYTYFRPKWGLP